MKSLSAFLLVASIFVTGCATTSGPKTVGQLYESALKRKDLVAIQKMFDEGYVPGQGETDNLLSDGMGYAEYYGHRALADLIIKRCQEAFVQGQNCATVPCYVARLKDTAMLTAFIDKGIDVNAESSGASLLGCAVHEGNTANAKFLIARGADIEGAIARIEESNAKLVAIDHPTARTNLAKNATALKMLERLRPGGAPTAASAPAGGGISKAEMEQIVKSAVAATAQPKPAPAAAPAEIKSDVDAPAYKVTANPDAFAIVVGVEKYNALPDAKFAERDAKAMNAHLLAMGYPQRNIVLLTGPAATRTGLVKNLEAWLPNQVTERSTVMFYFSGHGAPDAKTSEAYLVPMDGDPQYLEETAYPIKRLYEKLSALKAKRVLVALDSCFSGAGGRSVLASGTRPLVAKLKLAPGEGKIVSLAASSSEEITGALEEQGHGLFTYHLLKALGETAGRGSVSEIHAALTPRVQDEARRQNRAQTPQMFGSALDAGLR